MRRREFITLLGGAAAAWPLAARAQQAKVRRIGFLHDVRRPSPEVDAFRQGLRDLGYIEGMENINIEYRFASGRVERLPEPCSRTGPSKAPDVIVQPNYGGVSGRQTSNRHNSHRSSRA